MSVDAEYEELPEVSFVLTPEEAIVLLYTTPLVSKLEFKLKCVTYIPSLVVISQIILGPIKLIHTKKLGPYSFHCFPYAK